MRVLKACCCWRAAPAVVVTLLASVASAQDARPAIKVTEAGGAAYRIAVQRFAVAPEQRRRADELHTALRAGLEFSSAFTLLDERAFLGPVRSPALQGAAAPDCESWRQASADALLQGEVSLARGVLQVDYRLYDVVRCKALLGGQRIRVAPEHTVRSGRVIADSVVTAFTGAPGVSDTELAFVSNRNGHREIWVSDADGGNQRVTTRNRSIGSFPDWAPDGDALVYTSYHHRNRPWLFVMSRGARAFGRILRLLDADMRLYRGVYAPDGERLALVLSRGQASELYLSDERGRELVRLTRNYAIDISPSWSPDGARLAYVSDRSGAPEIYVMDADGSNSRRLTYDGSYNAAPAWSPDGRWIAYETRVKGQFDLWLIDPQGRSNQPLVTHRRSDEHPTWSPDSRKLAFQSTRRGRADIYMIDLNGKNLRRITNEGENTSPDWGPYRAPPTARGGRL